jgi:predicted methyltransferase
MISCGEENSTRVAEETAAVEAEAVAEAPAAPDYAAILAAEDRTEEDKTRDASRHPAEALALMGVMSGDVIIDIGAGSGFYSEAFARVVGEEGFVHAVNNPGSLERFPQIIPALDDRVAMVAPATIHPMAMEFADIPPFGANVAFIGQMYHEVIRQDMDAAAINAAVFSALKPGGIYAIEIHNAAAGSGREVSESYHRADPDIVRTEVLAAGFELVEENTTLFANPDDPLDILVFDESIRGNTARTLFIFRKP